MIVFFSYSIIREGLITCPVHCTLYSVYCTLYTIVFCAQYTVLRIVHYTQYPVLYTIHCYVHSTLYTFLYTVFIRWLDDFAGKTLYYSSIYRIHFFVLFIITSQKELGRCKWVHSDPIQKKNIDLWQKEEESGFFLFFNSKYKNYIELFLTLTMPP